MKISLVKEMRQVDKLAVEKYGLPELLLMENAGSRVAVATMHYLRGLRGRHFVILAGTGNNGGDAYVAARHLANKGSEVKLFAVGNPQHLTPSTAIQKSIAAKMGLEAIWLTDDAAFAELQQALPMTDAVIDGMLGTGFKGILKPAVARAVKVINSCHKPIVAIDIASGVDADTGAAAEAVKASLTVSLALPKPGQLLSPGREFTGELKVSFIGVPHQLLEDDAIKQELLDEGMVKRLLPKRSPAAHKGTCGRLLVIAGSVGMTGAAALASRSAMRAGAGIVTLALPASLNNAMEVKLTEVMTVPVPEAEPGILGGDEAFDCLAQLAEKYDAILLGPGLGRHASTQKLVLQLTQTVDKPFIIDADGIFAFKGHPELLLRLKQQPVITPHLGELATLLDLSVVELRADLLERVRQAAIDYRMVLVAKSECTLVAQPDGMVYFASTGNPGMATGGAGDVLAGSIAGLSRQVAGLAAAAKVGVWLHGTAGDLAYETKGNGLIASDICEGLPEALLKLK